MEESTKRTFGAQTRSGSRLDILVTENFIFWSTQGLYEVNMKTKFLNNKFHAPYILCH